MTGMEFKFADYVALRRNIDPFTTMLEGRSYSDSVIELTDVLAAHFPSLTQKHNPIVVNLSAWGPSALRYIIQEYSAFSNAAIHMFLEARIRNHWPDLTEEIIRNMNEEMGALTRGIPHLELMRHGYRVELGIETESYEPSAMTRDFINQMNKLFCTSDNVFLAGVLLAFETTAVDEFHVVDRMLRRYKSLLGGVITSESLTGEYIAGHVAADGEGEGADPEMDHRRRMIAAIGEHVGVHRQTLARGFLGVCLELNRWWEQVGIEALRYDVRNQLSSKPHKQQDPYVGLISRAREATVEEG